MHAGDSFGSALANWMRLRKLNTKPSTHSFYGFVHALMVREWPDVDQRIDAVSLDDVLRFCERVAHYSPSYWNAMVAALHELVPAARSLKFRSMRMKDRALINQQQFSELLAECDRLKRSQAGNVVRFLAHTGLRIREARLVRWVDVGPDCIMVRADSTKNGKARVIPFVQGTAEVLARLRAVTGSREFVLPRSEIRRGLSMACERAGVAPLSHHDFRHLFATRCIQSGVDLPTVARWLGHQDGGALLARTYFHLVDEHSRAMAARVRV